MSEGGHYEWRVVHGERVRVWICPPKHAVAQDLIQRKGRIRPKLRDANELSRLRHRKGKR